MKGFMQPYRGAMRKTYVILLGALRSSSGMIFFFEVLFLFFSCHLYFLL
jgi:hypothetical protein